ncbi:MAG TPA: META domain-containing protein [Aliiroseovarius sp.]|nr:META domain-containing protein [Aliiroseovarius sp.]
MRAISALALAPLLLAACQQDESIAAFLPEGSTWQLAELAGTPFAGRAEISFGPHGTVRGRAPCNSFRASQTAPYPWVEITDLVTARTTCGQIGQERAFLSALGQAAFAEVAGEVLILTSEEGREMVFRRTWP